MRTYQEDLRVYSRRVARVLFRQMARDALHVGMRRMVAIAADAALGRKHVVELLPDDADLDIVSGCLHCGMLVQVRFAALADR